MRDGRRDTDVKNKLLDSVEEGKGGMIWETSIETCVLLPWNRWPVHVWCMKQGIQSQCTGMTQRDEMGKEVGGGDTCRPIANSCKHMAKNWWLDTNRLLICDSLLFVVTLLAEPHEVTGKIVAHNKWNKV